MTELNPATEKNPVHARCRDDACGHIWVVAYLPMEAQQFNRCASSATCAMCGSKKPTLSAPPPEKIVRADRGPYPPFFGRLSTELLVDTAQRADARAIGGVSPAATAIYALLDQCARMEAAFALEAGVKP